MIEEPTLRGDGLYLRPWDAQRDLSSLVSVFDDTSVAYRTPIASEFGPAQAAAFLGLVDDGVRVHFAICATDGTVVGYLMINRSTQSISYVVKKDYRGRGVATRAVQLSLTHQAVVPTQDVWLEIEPDNEASIAVARRCGFVRTDLLPETVEDKGRRYVLKNGAGRPNLRRQPDDGRAIPVCLGRPRQRAGEEPVRAVALRAPLAPSRRTDETLGR